MTDTVEEPEPVLESGPFHLDVVDSDDLAKIRCTQCNLSTVHVWRKVEPFGPVSMLEAIKLHRRLIMCTECGNLSLKK